MPKHDVDLFSLLYIIMQHREGDLGTFFGHENHPYPPPLFDRRKLRSTKKSDLLSILVQETESGEHFASFDVKVLDGAAIVHLLPTTNITTFDEYASDVVISYIKKQFDKSTHVDVVWDAYLSSSIKESTKKKRGRGIRRRVEGRNKIPSNWPDFLRDSINKQELFTFLSSKIELTDCLEGMQIFATSSTAMIARGTSHLMESCDHEEADTRILIHLL